LTTTPGEFKKALQAKRRRQHRTRWIVLGSGFLVLLLAGIATWLVWFSSVFAATEVSEETRSRLKTVLSRLHLLGLAERTFSAWATLHSTMAFEAFITDAPLPVTAAQLMGGRKLLGFWTRAFLSDAWCRRCRLFSDLPIATPAELEAMAPEE